MLAQIEQANITGIVTDGNGAGAGADAVVTAVNTSTKLSVETKTNSTGAYRIVFLGAGQYALVAEKGRIRQCAFQVSFSPWA